MRIRELEWNDFPSLTENYYALYEEVQSNPDMGISLFPEKPTLAAEADWFAALFRQVQEKSGVACVAEEAGRAIGECHVGRKAPTVEAQHVGVLGILVAREFRGRGVGRALMQSCLERCRGKFQLVELSVFATNGAGRKLYESLGFRTWGSLPAGILRQGRYIDLVHMVRDLRTEHEHSGGANSA